MNVNACVICLAPATKVSIYVPGKKSQLILGATNPGEINTVMFGICDDHLDENGDFKEGVKEQISKAILTKVREPNTPHLDTKLPINELLDGFDGSF